MAEPKKTKLIQTRVTEEERKAFTEALEAIEIAEPDFLRAAIKALVVTLEQKQNLALPIRFVTVEQKRKLKK